MNAASSVPTVGHFRCSQVRVRSHQEPMVVMSLSERLQIRALRTRELLELLEDEDEMNLMIRCSEKFQRLQQAVEKMLVSNQKLAKANLSQKPTLRDAKLLLAMKYKELEELRRVVQVKQEQLAETHSVHHTQLGLLETINHTEKEFELLFERFADGKTDLEDFLDSFLISKKLHHIRLVLFKKLHEIIRQEGTTTPREKLPGFSSAGFPEQIHPTYSLKASSCSHLLFVLPFCTHVSSDVCLHQPLFVSDHYENIHSGHGRSLPRPTRPARLQPLKMQRRRCQQQ